MSIIGGSALLTIQKAGTWVSGALATNPSANDILATTGQLNAGDYFFAFILHADTATTVDLVHRNAANGTDLFSKEVPLLADSVVELTFPIKMTMAADERMYVRQKGNLTGDVQASIIYARIAE